VVRMQIDSVTQVTYETEAFAVVVKRSRV